MGGQSEAQEGKPWDRSVWGQMPAGRPPNPKVWSLDQSGFRGMGQHWKLGTLRVPY